jgi:uncharacterized Zn ribbon protein
MKKMPENALNALTFNCINCDFKCFKKSNYDKHLMTSKHKNRIKLNDLEQIMPENAKFKCKNCSKEYNARNSLWYHEKKCINKKTCNFEYKQCSIIENKNENNEISDKELIIMIMKQNAELIKGHTDLIKENTEMKNIMLEQQSMIMKVIENGTHNTINNHNFNLNFFLNETCKNALNIDDFVSSVKVSLSELENTGRRGYVEGISSIILNKLNTLSHSDRPIHCSDYKRETMYIKNDNQWIKETQEKPILKKAIKTIANENIKQINVWRQQYPDCTDSESKKNNLYLKIVSNSMCGSTKEESEKNYEKIISNVAKQVIIDK